MKKIIYFFLFYDKKEKLQRQNISELDVFRYYIKLLQKMRDLGQDDIRQIKQCLELCHIIFSICKVQKRLMVENDNEELSMINE